MAETVGKPEWIAWDLAEEIVHPAAWKLWKEAGVVK